MKFIVTCLLAFITLNVLAQSPSGFHWNDSRGLFELSEEEKAEPVIQLEYQVLYEFTYENSELVLYYTEHEIIRVNNDEAIAQHNRIYIPTQNALELTEIHARTIKADGSVIELDENNIKEVEDEEQGRGFKIFAIEGAEIGSEIEYYYTIKRTPRYFGRDYFQGRVPVRHAGFELSSPSNLQFEFKSYAGMPEITGEETDERNIYKTEASDIPALKPEEFAIYNQHRKRVEFKLAYNTANTRARLLTWEDVGKRVFENTYGIEKKEAKDVENWLGSLKLKGLENAQKAAKIEDEVKVNFYLDESGSSSDNLSDIIRQKAGTSYGLHRLLCNAFKIEGIPHEIVLTTDRSGIKFDGSFDSYSYLEDYLIYLTEQDAFIAAHDQRHRVGLTPARYTANEAIFIGTRVVRDMVFPVTEVRFIPAAPYTTNFDNLNVNVTFNETLSGNAINIERSFEGYNSTYIKSILPFLEEKEKDEMIGQFIKFVSPDAEFESKEMVNASSSWETWEEPLVIRGSVSSAHFIEVAGNTILFKAGELIGPQSELYQETERKMDVANDYNRGYIRKISIDLPEGYAVQNPDDLNIHEFSKNEEGKTIYLFKSQYELKGNKLSVIIDEFYDQIYYPADKFEDFRKVINAAADFNKVVLVLKKAS